VHEVLISVLKADEAAAESRGLGDGVGGAEYPQPIVSSCSSGGRGVVGGGKGGEGVGGRPCPRGSCSGPSFGRASDSERG
jgi:hypothetical protein